MSNDERSTHHTAGPPTADHGPVPRYEIRVKGRLAPRWSAWFDGLDVTTGDDGTTAIAGPIVDQAALHGLLQKLRDIGIPLISVTRVETPTTSGLAPRDERS